MALSEAERSRRRRTQSKAAYHVHVWEQEPATTWAEYTAHMWTEPRAGGRSGVTRVPGALKCGAGEELRLEAHGTWLDYEPPPAPALQLEHAATTAGTVGVAFDWLPHAYCAVELTGGTRAVLPLCVLPTGPVVRDTRMCAYRALFSNLEPDTQYSVRVVGHWQHERLVSHALEVCTRAATAPSLVLVSAADGCAELLMDTDLILEALDVAVYRLSSPCCLLEEVVGYEEAVEDWDSVCPRDTAVCVNWAGHGRRRLLLHGMAACERYGVRVTGHIGGAGGRRIGTRVLAFAQPPRTISLMELLGLGFGDWHTITTTALKKAWHGALRCYHQDKNASAHRQYTDTVIEKGSAAVELLKAGRRLEASDFMPASLTPPTVDVRLSWEERRCAARRTSSGESLCTFEGGDAVRVARYGLEVLLRAPVRLYAGPRSLSPSDEDLTCYALLCGAGACPRSDRASSFDATSSCSSDASTRAPPSPTASPERAPEITVLAAGATFLQLNISSCDAHLRYRVGFARAFGRMDEASSVLGGLVAGSLVAHFPELQLDTAYEVTVLHGETNAVLTRMQARTLPPRPPPGLSHPLGGEEEKGAQAASKAAAPKKKRIWLERMVELGRPLQPHELLPKDCVSVGSTSTVVLRVPEGWKLTLELRAPCGTWRPLCTQEEGVHLCEVAPLPFGERTFRLHGSRALRWHLDSL